MWRLLGLFPISIFIYCILILINTGEGISINNSNSTDTITHDQVSPPVTVPCGPACDLSPPTTDIPALDQITTSIPFITSSTPVTRQEGHLGLPKPPSSYADLSKLLSQNLRQCRETSKLKLRAFSCKKFKMSSWLMNELDRNTTNLLSSYVQLVKNSDDSDPSDDSLLPETGPERLVYRMITSFGEPVDKLIFYQMKKYTKSRHLQVTVPHLVTVQLEPRTQTEVITGRTLFDPGFNMKLKFPFFHDELKVAVTTGPSFLAGLGVGLVVLGIKSIFAPFVLAMKAVILSWFFKDMSPVDFVKALAHPVLPAWMTGWKPEPEPHFSGWHNAIHHYEPPKTHGPEYGWGSHGKEAGLSSGLMGVLTNLLPFTSPGEDSAYHSNSHSGPSSSYPPSRPTATYTGSSPSYGHGRPPTHYDGVHRPVYHSEVDESHQDEGRHQGYSSPGSTDDDDDGYEQNDTPSSGPSSTVDSVVENLDPFYSPLLSRIDSIFVHLGFTEEGCKERAVCSIYKYPVKYAPYSNLLSAQLSKHQSELKRPVNTSPQVLRYFKYMKAAKDGQAALDCLNLYPKCTSDTEQLTNLPMVKTFQQLTELMGPTGTTG